MWAVVLDGIRHVFIPRGWESAEFRRKHRLHNCFGNLQEERSGLNSRLWGQRSEGTQEQYREVGVRRDRDGASVSGE